ncbi:hypothetical protein TCAL_17008 [Tigriopus californicus]|uniref:DUF19 domain-containing protein n=1 Tax=Tigriopus californicus TaxID=6832 RepID=A0A553PFN7_TIGCA|nr:uncharacterized protein LOC131880061 [Tigriopus californicus]XP_059082545.1 uncharacterized protein LOC131880061 [Tigriopus californicus]XP_059082546.1 uncharacterized protein LOC131880061 [Tigriopus californicus]XP_059082547.1 uncharacterized protein LOC131880061 [Tigriopus californicus]TRY76486.1 hypothetical protein TCAL_17008 [Tigriopus californicus]|eukprot:TCALIF_03514-PB protein Name:"Protein of unknown function" AED:0.02 eAED:0.02 QI:446/1/1/1/0.4/0.5/6/295/295
MKPSSTISHCLRVVGWMLLANQCLANECKPEAMARCTDPLKVVTDNKDLGFATSIDELQKMCPKLMDGLRCIDDFTYRCLDDEHRNYFNTLYQGTTQVIVDLCQEGPYQKDYLRHAPCMREVQEGYEQCADEYQVRIKNLSGRSDEGAQTENEENVQLLCCSFQQYLHCSEGVVNRTCGPETAQFTKSFLDRMSGPLIQGHCQAYEHGSHGCSHAPRLGDDYPIATDGQYSNDNHQQHHDGSNARPLWPEYSAASPRNNDVSSAPSVSLAHGSMTFLSSVFAFVMMTNWCTLMMR